MINRVQRKFPVFCFEKNCNSLLDSVFACTSLIAPINISYKNLDADYSVIVESVQSALSKNGLWIRQQVVFTGDLYELSSIIYHNISNESFELRQPIISDETKHAEFERSVKYLKIRAYVELLGLSISENTNSALLSLKNIDAPNISWNAIKLFLECPRCFYLSKKCRMPYDENSDKFVLANANDLFLKDEFDKCRRLERPHPLMIKNGIEAIPFNHPSIDLWRKADYGRGGIKFYDDIANIIFSGVVDDIWINQQGRLIIVDYKTTIKEIVTLNDELGSSYRRQISYYAWLFQKNGYPIDSVGYIILDRPRFTPIFDYQDVVFGRVPKDEYIFNAFGDSKEYKRLLAFDTSVLPIPIHYDWIEKTIADIAECLKQDNLPSELITSNRCFSCRAYKTRKQYEDWITKRNNVQF